MGNFIDLSYDCQTEDDMHLSNGMTSVLMNVLALAGSELAETPMQKRLIVRLCENDQIRGIGTVGFCISELPWEEETLEEDKAFLLRVVGAAKNKTGWERIDFSPREDWTMDSLDNFARLISRMTADRIDRKRIKEWDDMSGEDDPIYNGFPRCEKHGVLLSCYGCIICNDE